jgi:hypothetical protein
MHFGQPSTADRVKAFIEAEAPPGDGHEECLVVAGAPFPRRDVGIAYVQGADDDKDAWCQGLRSLCSGTIAELS